MNALHLRILSLSLLLTVLLGCAPTDSSTSNAPQGLEGSWRAVLLSPGGDLPFAMEITLDGGAFSGVVVNGTEESPFSSVRVEGDAITLEFDWYDSRIDARIEEDGSLSGRWQKTAADFGISALDFLAVRDGSQRFLPVTEDAPDAPADLSGIWRAEFTDEDGSEPAQGEFRQAGDGRVLGTFLTPTGDYRFLEGSYESGLLRLSTFDGAHAFLFHAKADSTGNLTGDFWSRDSYHATWTAVRDDGAEAILPDAWSLAGLTNDEGRFRFAFDDLDGKTMTHEDPRFAGKVVIANVFGSWCPNCNDKAPLLAEWYRTYRDQGLEIVGLAYEYSGDTERDRVYVRKFADRHGVEFPLLLAGTSDKQAAAETLPDLTAVIAFPTSIFIGRDGRVRRIHSGFSGPGTGAHYDELVAEFEALIEALLSEEA